jgi:hypothetical protein
MAFDFDPRALPQVSTTASSSVGPLSAGAPWLTSLPWLMRAENVQPTPMGANWLDIFANGTDSAVCHK